MNFTAIDFETANGSRTSACSVGLVVVKSDEIVHTYESLIVPDPFIFNPFNVGIHGITEDDVADAPPWSEVWKQIKPYIENRFVIAHNASFDMSVLANSCELHNINLPNFRFLCTYKMAQQLLPHMDRYRLDALCAHFDIELCHHNACSDSIAAANLFLRFMHDFEISSHDDLFRNGIFPGEVCNGTMNKCEITNPRSSKHKRFEAAKASNYRNVISDYADADFCGKRFVFTGALSSMSRDKAYEIVALGGGIPQDAITRNTDCLVFGIQDYKKTNGALSTKMKKAMEINKNGGSIQMLVEDEFLSLIDDELFKRSGLQA